MKTLRVLGLFIATPCIWVGGLMFWVLGSCLAVIELGSWLSTGMPNGTFRADFMYVIAFAFAAHAGGALLRIACGPYTFAEVFAALRTRYTRYLDGKLSKNPPYCRHGKFATKCWECLIEKEEKDRIAYEAGP